MIADHSQPVRRTKKDCPIAVPNNHSIPSVMAKSKLQRLRTAHATVAKLVVDDLAYLPIFHRLDAELAAAEAKEKGDPIAYARAALSAQNARL